MAIDLNKYKLQNNLDKYKLPGATPGGFPAAEPSEVKQSFMSRLGGFAKGVGSALTSSEQTLGRGLSTVFDKNTQRTVEDIGQQEQTGQRSVIDAIQKESDPEKKQRLVEFLKTHYATDYQAPTATDINPAFGMSNKEVLGAATGTALDVLSFGSYGNAAKGAVTGERLVKAKKTVEEIAAAKAALKALPATTKALNVAKTVVKGGATGYGYDVAGNLQANKDNVFKPGLGAALGAGIPLAVEAAKGLGYIAKEVAKHTSSALSGVPKAAMEEAFSNPTAVQNAMRLAAKDGDGAAQKIHDNAMDALATLKKARSNAYEAGLAKVQNEATYTKGGQLYVKRILTDAEAKMTKGYVPGTKIGVPTKLTTGGIKNVFTSTLKEFGATGKGTALDYTNVALDDSHLAKLDKLQQRIYNWTDNTPVGMNRLRQVVDSYRIGGIQLGSSENKFNAIVTGLKQNIAGYLGKRVPQIGEMNATHAAESAVIDNIVNQLKLQSADPNTALRKLVNVFNPKSQVYRPVVEQLGEKGAKGLMADIAGLTMSKYTPEGMAKYFDTVLGSAGATAAILNPATLLGTVPAVAMASPRTVGEAITFAGKLAQNKKAQAIARTTSLAGKIGAKLTARQSGLKK